MKPTNFAIVPNRRTARFPRRVVERAGQEARLPLGAFGIKIALAEIGRGIPGADGAKSLATTASLYFPLTFRAKPAMSPLRLMARACQNADRRHLGCDLFPTLTR